MIDPELVLEEKIDRLVDQGTHSYDEARRLYGVEAPDPNDFTVEAIKARTGFVGHAVSEHDKWVVGELHVTHPRSAYPDGVPRATAEQRAATTSRRNEVAQQVRQMGDRPTINQ